MILSSLFAKFVGFFAPKKEVEEREPTIFAGIEMIGHCTETGERVCHFGIYIDLHDAEKGKDVLVWLPVETRDEKSIALLEQLCPGDWIEGDEKDVPPLGCIMRNIISRDDMISVDLSKVEEISGKPAPISASTSPRRGGIHLKV